MTKMSLILNLISIPVNNFFYFMLDTAGTGPATSSFFSCGVVDKFVVDIETDL